MAHKIYLKKITRDYNVKPTIFERYVLWSMKLTEEWLFFFIIAIFLLVSTIILLIYIALLAIFG